MASLQIPVTEADHAKGRPDAPVTLVEYGDYECPHCGAAYPVVKQLQKRFGADLRFVFRNFPLGEIHPNAVSAAMTAEFGAAHGRFWNVHDALFENQKKLGAALYQAIVTEVQLNVAQLRAALEANTYLERVRADFNGGVRSGVNGTPSFFVNGKRYDGSPDFTTMADALAEVIRAAKARGR
jgi:protein-disulfide isomerase